MSLNHHCTCSAFIPEGPQKRFVLNLQTPHYILSYLGPESSTWKGSTDMGIFSPGDGTWQYSMMRSAMNRLRFTQAGGGSWLAAAL